jgi:prevent-host-death family protein
MKKRVVNATEFKAKYSAFLDQVEQNGEPITILRRGRPVAVVGPAKKTVWKSPAGMWIGKVDIVGDIMADTSDLWGVLKEK